ncbi:hypothetical protein ZWY2020_009684 [Hordeum vulgare]|nr:hypothetical protein ZWY2020_009684 [Hordeum vulgare]
MRDNAARNHLKLAAALARQLRALKLNHACTQPNRAVQWNANATLLSRRLAGRAGDRNGTRPPTLLLLGRPAPPISDLQPAVDELAALVRSGLAGLVSAFRRVAQGQPGSGRVLACLAAAALLVAASLPTGAREADLIAHGRRAEPADPPAQDDGTDDASAALRLLLLVCSLRLASAMAMMTASAPGVIAVRRRLPLLRSSASARSAPLLPGHVVAARWYFCASAVEHVATSVGPRWPRVSVGGDSSCTGRMPSPFLARSAAASANNSENWPAADVAVVDGAKMSAHGWHLCAAAVGDEVRRAGVGGQRGGDEQRGGG